MQTIHNASFSPQFAIRLKSTALLASALMIGLCAQGQETNNAPELDPSQATNAPARMPDPGNDVPMETTNIIDVVVNGAVTNTGSDTNASIETNVVFTTNVVITPKTDVGPGNVENRTNNFSQRDSQGGPIPSSRDTAAAQPAHMEGSDYRAFRIITERNIFNPSRAPGYVRVERREFRRTVTTESFTLTGTMSYEKGYFAFFDGSRPDYHRTLKPGDIIAGHRVNAIEYNFVKLQTGTNVFELHVGAHMARGTTGGWAMSDLSGAYLGATPGSTASTNAESGIATSIEESNTNAVPSSSGSSSADEVLKRLMQRREQEMNK